MANPIQGSPETIQERREQRHESHAASTWKNFLKSLCALSGMDERAAEQAAVTVLSALEQRLYGTEARDLEAQLPSKLRDLLSHRDHHEGKPVRKFGRDEFFQMIASELGKPPNEIEPVIRAVFAAVRAQITEGEASNVADQLPSDLAVLWVQPA